MNHRARNILLQCFFIVLLVPCGYTTAQEYEHSARVRSPGAWEWVPAQADFFWGIHHLEHQLHAAGQSQIAKRAVETSLWKKSQEFLLKEWKDRKSDLAIWKARLDNPAAREIRAFLYDIVSQDFFLFADGNLSRTVEQWNLILPTVEHVFSRETTVEDKADIVAQWVDEVVPRIQLPTLMLAGRYSNLDRALARVDEIEGAIRLGVSFVPDIANLFRNLRRVEDQRGNRLEWRIVSDMVPWEQIPETDILDRETLQDLRQACKNKTIVLSLGVLDDYFCFVVSGDKDWESRFGSGTKLGEHPLLTPQVSNYILKATDQEQSTVPVVTSTYLTSDEVVSAFQKLLLDGFFRKIARAFLLPLIQQQPAQSDTVVWLTSVLDDATWLDDRIGQHVVRYRGVSCVGWTSDRGWESVQVDRTPMELMQGDLPLLGIRKVEPAPLLVLNMRLATHPEYFATARQIVRRLKQSFDDLMLIQEAGVDPEPLKPFEGQIRELWPQIVDLTEQWHRQILPSLGGEYLVVIQSAGQESLRVPEVSFAGGLVDAGGFRKGAVSMLNTLGSILRNSGVRLLAPTSSVQTDGWTLDSFSQTFGQMIPGAWEGVCGTCDHWFWVGASRPQWERFAKTEHSQEDCARSLLGFEQADGPLGSAAIIDLGGLSKLGGDWLVYLVEQLPKESGGYLKVPSTATGRRLNLTVDEIRDFLECMNTLGRMTSFSKLKEDGETLSRSCYEWNR